MVGIPPSFCPVAIPRKVGGAKGDIHTQQKLDIGLQPTGCPYCAGRKAWKGFNDLGRSSQILLHRQMDGIPRVCSRHIISNSGDVLKDILGRQ